MARATQWALVSGSYYYSHSGEGIESVSPKLLDNCAASMQIKAATGRVFISSWKMTCTEKCVINHLDLA